MAFIGPQREMSEGGRSFAQVLCQNKRPRMHWAHTECYMGTTIIFGHHSSSSSNDAAHSIGLGAYSSTRLASALDPTQSVREGAS